jgi:drug/metabolite transporter (DMT)-like permease
MSSSLPSPAVAYAAGSATIMLWAGSFPAIAVGVRNVDPSALAAVRFAVAAAAASAWLIWRRDPLPTASDFARIAVCSVLGIALYNMLLNSGQRSVSPGAASFIVATQTVFAAGLSHLLGQQKVGRIAIGGTVLSLFGVGIISFGPAPDLTLGLGTALILLAAACSGMNFVLQQPLAVKYGGAAAACWTMVMGALFLAPWLPLGLEQTARSAEAIAAVGFLALGAGVLGYACWFTALAGLGAARAANLLFLMAPVAVILAIPISGHSPDLWTILGGAAALVGVAIVNRSYRRTSSAQQEL